MDINAERELATRALRLPAGARMRAEPEDVWESESARGRVEWGGGGRSRRSIQVALAPRDARVLSMPVIRLARPA